MINPEITSAIDKLIIALAGIKEVLKSEPEPDEALEDLKSRVEDLESESRAFDRRFDRIAEEASENSNNALASRIEDLESKMDDIESWFGKSPF